MDIHKLSEEARALLRLILEHQTYRQLMVANIRGHGLKFVPDLSKKVLLVRDLHEGLGTLEAVRGLYHDLDGGDLEAAIRPRLERMPYPSSRMELAICLVACDLAEHVSMESYVGSSCDEFAAIARDVRVHKRAATEAATELFETYCAEPSQRPHAQQVFSRWVTITLRSFGRPGSKRDSRVVELGLRTQSCGEMIEAYLVRLSELARVCSLTLPDFSETGLEIPGH